MMEHETERELEVPPGRVHLISLGCPKNLVDSELILGGLADRGWIPTIDLETADLVVVNTCSFIASARRESHAVIKDALSRKSVRQKVIVCGCLAQMCGQALLRRYPGLDGVVGTGDYGDMDRWMGRLWRRHGATVQVGHPRFIHDASNPRLLSTPSSYAFLKIAEGCSNHCAYCLIPRLRGEHRSRPIADVVEEARNLADLGIQELILVAQDTTRYGHDLAGRSLLPLLLERLEEVEDVHWVRLLYTHPAHFSARLIQVMAQSSKLCRYLDVPLQHTHSEILRKMGRPGFEETRRLLDRLREALPGLVLRTTFIVGYPGESAAHFAQLLRDTAELRFDWVGVFSYSCERGTPAARLPLRIPFQERERRRRELMLLQREIVNEKNQARVGSCVPVLRDGAGEGHASFQAPEIDGKIILSDTENSPVRETVRITGVHETYDLTATPAVPGSTG